MNIALSDTTAVYTYPHSGAVFGITIRVRYARVRTKRKQKEEGNDEKNKKKWLLEI